MKFMLSGPAKSAAGAKARRILLLGGVGMAAANQESGDSHGETNVARALALLAQALHILDEIGSRPDLGARLQDVIESLEEHRPLQQLPAERSGLPS